MTSSAADERQVVDQLIGAWRLVKWAETKPGNQETYPLGEDAVGQIIYTREGEVSAQIVRRNSGRFAAEDWREASNDEAARAWKDYLGYFGTYSLDLSRSAVIHHVDGGWFPNLKATEQVREFRFEGSQLILHAETSWGKVEIIWERVPR